MNRMLWPLGILLLVGSLVGAGWALNQSTPHLDSNGKDEGNSEAVSVVVCLGMVDVEKGVAELYPKQLGEVAEIADTHTPDGKDRHFKKGDLLLRLRSQMAEYQLGKANAAVRAAEADLEKAKKLEPELKIKLAMQQEVIRAYGHEKAKLEAELEHKKKLAKENIGDLSKEVLKAMQEAVGAIDARAKAEQLKLDDIKQFDPDLEVRRAAADVDAKRLDVKIADQNLKDFQLAAPFDGTVLRFHTRVGELLGPNPRGPAVEFCPDAPRIVRAEVIQEWGHRVHVGQDATIEDDSYLGPVWQGRVKGLSENYQHKKMKLIEPFMINDVRTLECIVTITGGKSPVRIGQRVRVKIKI